MINPVSIYYMFYNPGVHACLNMAMTYSSRQYIEDALNCTSHFALSYADPTQKWIIRQHLVSLFQDFPSMKPSIDTFTYNDGTRVNLLIASGEIHVSPSVPSVSLTIWVNENYPFVAPFVYVTPLNSSFSIYSDHPFVDSSGATASSYLSNWNQGCNLSEVVRNLVKLFSHFHPFYYSPSAWLSTAHPSFVSKREAMDRLACTLYYDIMAMRSKTEDEKEKLLAIKGELENRADIVASIVIGLQLEQDDLKERVKNLTDQADDLLNWVKVHNTRKTLGMVDDIDIDDAFEPVDDESRMVLEFSAADMAVEDLMYALDKAVEQGIFSFDSYIKQVRSLARTQFRYRYKQIKLLERSQK